MLTGCKFLLRDDLCKDVQVKNVPSTVTFQLNTLRQMAAFYVEHGRYRTNLDIQCIH